jgi:hypothetical protein
MPSYNERPVVLLLNPTALHCQTCRDKGGMQYRVVEAQHGSCSCHCGELQQTGVYLDMTESDEVGDISLKFLPFSYTIEITPSCNKKSK